jgi:putative CocE/NonD family hydrolase
VVSYETEPLTEQVTVAGPVVASMFVSTSGTDGDWVVKLIDVYPGDAKDNDPNPAGVRMGDFQMLVAAEVFRAKYRNSYSRPATLTPGAPTRLDFELRDKNHTFLKGHRIMVQVQSSWFPVIDRNPGKFVDIYHATPDDFQKTTQRVYRSAAKPSQIRLNVLSRPAS